MWNWIRGKFGLGTDDDVKTGAAFDDHDTDPAFAYEPTNIYHGTSVDPTRSDDHFLSPTYAFEACNIFHGTAVDPTSTPFDDSPSSGAALDFGDSFGGCDGIDMGSSFDSGGGFGGSSGFGSDF